MNAASFAAIYWIVVILGDLLWLCTDGQWFWRDPFTRKVRLARGVAGERLVIACLSLTPALGVIALANFLPGADR